METSRVTETIRNEQGQWIADTAVEFSEPMALAFNSHDDLLEALEIQHACGAPTTASLYDEEGIEGWRWTHPDGRQWEEVGDWWSKPPMHPVARAALAKAKGTKE